MNSALAAFDFGQETTIFGVHGTPSLGGRPPSLQGSADGWSHADRYHAEAELNDPETGTFTATGSMADVPVARTWAIGRVLMAWAGWLP